MLLSRRQQAQISGLVQPIRDVANIVPMPKMMSRMLGGSREPTNGDE
jgi:hypothetical protein